MARRRTTVAAVAGDEEPIISLSDLMSGLMLIFLLIALALLLIANTAREKAEHEADVSAERAERLAM